MWARFNDAATCGSDADELWRLEKWNFDSWRLSWVSDWHRFFKTADSFITSVCACMCARACVSMWWNQTQHRSNGFLPFINAACFWATASDFPRWTLLITAATHRQPEVINMSPPFSLLCCCLSFIWHCFSTSATSTGSQLCGQFAKEGATVGKGLQV